MAASRATHQPFTMACKHVAGARAAACMRTCKLMAGANTLQMVAACMRTCKLRANTLQMVAAYKRTSTLMAGANTQQVAGSGSMQMDELTHSRGPTHNRWQIAAASMRTCKLMAGGKHKAGSREHQQAQGVHTQSRKQTYGRGCVVHVSPNYGYSQAVCKSPNTAADSSKAAQKQGRH
eukprot:scaffold299186_cov18-Tisochrysis_lutea.AAC.1